MKTIIQIVTAVALSLLGVAWAGSAQDEANGTGASAMPAIGAAVAPHAAAKTTAGNVWWDNGPIVTRQGIGFEGNDISELQTNLSMNSYGFGHQRSAGLRVADDFTIPQGSMRYIHHIVFYAYQTGSTTNSTITNCNVRIWNDVPSNPPAAQVVFGDSVNNRLVSSTFSGVYRVLNTSVLDNSRPIMRNVVAIGAMFGPGTYWVDWQVDGTLGSGPWAPPITILGQTTTGNGLQNVGGWVPVLDSVAGPQQGFPFQIVGAHFALKVVKLKTKDKGPGASGFSALMGYNWNAHMPTGGMKIIVGAYTNAAIILEPKGSTFVYNDANLSVKLTPAKHTVLAKAKNIDPVGAGPGCTIALSINGVGLPFNQERLAALDNGSYCESKNLQTNLFFLEKAKISDSATPLGDTAGLRGTLNPVNGSGGGTGMRIAIASENGVVVEQTIAEAAFTVKNGTYSYKRPEGVAAPVSSVVFMREAKSIKVSIDNFDIPAAIGSETDPMISVEVIMDFTTFSGGGPVQVRFAQPKPGQLKY